ncbi:MAG: Na/Pi cotransporter family protein [Clostridia bacterium]|nr:Na/Pi cotransporter family protein [Clostridia bacterium]
MTVFDIFTLLGGLAFFLFGMHIMSSGLEKIAGGKLEIILRKMTDKPIKGLLLGAAVTATIQSSSAVTVMLVGLVNSGIMKLGQTIGVIMGSNIGTTLTAWILSLAGIESDNFFLKMLKPSSFSPIIALVGIIMIMASKREKVKDVGSSLMGFAVLMYGMQLMSSATTPLSESEKFGQMLIYFKNPLLGVLVGLVITGIVQSSAATIGILQALSMTGAITYSMAIPIIMGENIGTCVTSLLSSIGVSKDAKRVSFIHIMIKVIGTVFYLTIYFALDIAIGFTFSDDAASPVGIAVVHTIFNIATTVLLFPFSKFLEKFALKVIKDNGKDEKKAFIDDRLLNSPSLAISECKSKTIFMSRTAKDSLFDSISLLSDYDNKVADRILKYEETLDELEDSLGTFLVKLSSRELSKEDSNTISILLHTIGDFERIGDHAVNILKVAKEISDKGISFSDEATAELKTATDAITEILDITIDAFCHGNATLALEVEPLEQVIDNLLSEIKDRHIQRLTGGNCTIELGFVLSDLITNYERVSDHCSNIAVCIIQISNSVFDTHGYLNNYKSSEAGKFVETFELYKEKYNLPKKRKDA